VRHRSRLVKFSCWCPKVMSAIGKLPETLADRCILIRMQRKGKNERCERLEDFDATEMRQKCARFVEDHAEAIRTRRPEIPAALNDRAADIWEPLLVLADLAGGEWPALARRAAENLSGSQSEMSPLESLLLQVQRLFEETGRDRVFSKTIVERVNQDDDCPWEGNGKGVDERWLARQLRAFGIRPSTLWIGNESAKGYYLNDFKELFERYGTGRITNGEAECRTTTDE
jgi:hypothetical protein